MSFAPFDSQPPGGSSRPPDSPDAVLPPVEPPSAGFILQLFFIPLAIVAIVVAVWLMFSWIAQAGNDPRDLVANLKKLNESSWQSALSLAEQLKNPEYDALKDDRQLARELAAVLDSELDAARDDESRLRLRIFLCRALGEFRAPDGIDTLLRAAEQQRKPAEISVRAAAVEALAVVAAQQKDPTTSLDPRIRTAMIAASRERADATDQQQLAAELRSRAAFALGVLGDQESCDRLAVLVEDAYPNVRYNASTGLARNGDLRAVPTLLEMLDPDNTSGFVDELSTGEKQQKLARILLNAVRASYQLLELHNSGVRGPDEHSALASLRTALQRLSKTRDMPAVQSAATEALLRLDGK